jgi:hypothetical protein
MSTGYFTFIQHPTWKKEFCLSKGKILMFTLTFHFFMYFACHMYFPTCIYFVSKKIFIKQLMLTFIMNVVKCY